MQECYKCAHINYPAGIACKACWEVITGHHQFIDECRMCLDSGIDGENCCDCEKIIGKEWD